MKDPDNHPQKLSRRSFFQSAGVSAAALAGMPLLINSCSTGASDSAIDEFFSMGDVVVFQGDSITDAGRNKKRELPNTAGSFGGGYAFLAASFLLEVLAAKELTIYNRGISGNKVFQLADRWDIDCINLKPNVLSILIGVNDYWHFRNGNYDGTPEIYENDYRRLLERTRNDLPGIKLVICQPFILTGTRSVDESWLEPFSAYQEIARKISDEFEATWVPFQEAFDRAIETAHPTYWAEDGVHPTMAGAQLMARTWLEAI